MNGQVMQQLEIGFKRLSDDAVLPTKTDSIDSGFALFAAEDVIIAPGETKVIKTDIAIQLPNGYEAQVRPRSEITSNTKLRVQLGTIDESYRGNIGIIIDNIADKGSHITKGIWAISTDFYEVEHPTDSHSYGIRKGDKIAQLVVQAIPLTTAVEIKELSETKSN